MKPLPPLRFVYPDRDDAPKMRVLSLWMDEPGHVVGFCDVTGGGFRSFKKSRILEWLDTPLGVAFPYQTDEPSPARPPRSPDILFTGFGKADRARLESAASEAGFVVRTRVTNELSVLVAGPNAGWAKLRDAKQQGASVIDEEDCDNLFADGLLP